MTDRRRINGPIGGSTPSLFTNTVYARGRAGQPRHTRDLSSLRKTFLKTGVTPSASGSAYLEIEPHAPEREALVNTVSVSRLKLICTVHGPRPLPRSAPFTPHMVLSASVKYATFATQERRGYVRDSREKDLAVHLEAALRGVIIGDRWPKSSVEVIITILEGEEESILQPRATANSTYEEVWGTMSLLSGCLTVASAAIIDAGIDCVDSISGGMTAFVHDDRQDIPGQELSSAPRTSIIVNPAPSDYEDILAACVIGYLPSRDEITDIWIRGELKDFANSKTRPLDTASHDLLIEKAIQAAHGSQIVLTTALREVLNRRLKIDKGNDVSL